MHLLVLILLAGLWRRFFNPRIRMGIRTVEFTEALRYLREDLPDTRSIRRFNWHAHTMFITRYGTLMEHWQGTDTLHVYRPTQEDILADDWVLE